MNLTRIFKVSPRDRGAIQFDIAVYGALGGGCVVAIIQLSTSSQLSTALIVAVHSFAIAIPLLLGASVSCRTILHRGIGSPAAGIATHAFGIAGILGAITGVAAMFFHFGFSVGLAFIVVLLAVVITLYWLLPLDIEFKNGAFQIRDDLSD